MGWVGLGRVGFGRDFSVLGGLGWVHCSKSTENLKGLYVNAFKARLDKIWLHQAVKFISCIALGRVGSKFFPLLVGRVGLRQSADELGWIGSHKMDPWTTLHCFGDRHLSSYGAIVKNNASLSARPSVLDLWSTAKLCCDSVSCSRLIWA